jgi:DNA-binding transcriptional ArsR family regulator
VAIADPRTVQSIAEPGGTALIEVFKALGDPVRWSIVVQAAAVDELGAAELETTLSVSKPTISYHTKILIQAGVLVLRKDGRHAYYTLRRDVLQAVIGELRESVPGPRPVRESAPGRSRSRKPARTATSSGPVVGKDDLVLLTW